MIWDETERESACLGEVPQSINRLVVQGEAGIDAVGIRGAGHGLDLRVLCIAKTVVVEVVDVGHVDGVLEHAPVAALKLYLPIDRPPFGVLQLRHMWDGGPLLCRQVLAAVEEPDEATLQPQMPASVLLQCRRPAEFLSGLLFPQAPAEETVKPDCLIACETQPFLTQK